jgi:5-methylcytosine-specific restriction enzyme subunit McrC
LTTQIPIQNIYYLLCYAWDKLAEGEIVDVSNVDSAEVVDLFATVLIGGTRHLIRRGLEQGYQEHEENLAGIRGRVQVANSIRRMLFEQGKANCLFDELTADTLSNRILKATMLRLIGVPSLNTKLRDELRGLVVRLQPVKNIDLSCLAFRRVQIHGNNRYYRFLINICEFVANSWLVDEQSGGRKFRDFVRDKRMAKLFEAFVLNLLRRELRDWSVGSERISWIGLENTNADNDFLPQMQTDISIRSESSTLLIDTKYYGEMFAGRYEAERFHSAHLYQLFAYVKNLESRIGPDSRAKGMLLYPKVHRDVCECFHLHGHEMWVCTIDLFQDWREIRQNLLSLVTAALGESPAGPASVRTTRTRALA